MPIIWLTINPSNLQNPLVLLFARVDYSTAFLSLTTATVCQAMATSNPMAVAQFFHYTCKAVLDGLLATQSNRPSILGDVSNYFSIVETNGQGMLHLHTLI
jgi:hypothetical protein